MIKVRTEHAIANNSIRSTGEAKNMQTKHKREENEGKQFDNMGEGRSTHPGKRHGEEEKLRGWRWRGKRDGDEDEKIVHVKNEVCGAFLDINTGERMSAHNKPSPTGRSRLCV